MLFAAVSNHFLVLLALHKMWSDWGWKVAVGGLVVYLALRAAGEL